MKIAQSSVFVVFVDYSTTTVTPINSSSSRSSCCPKNNFNL